MQLFAQPFPVYESWVKRNRGMMQWQIGKTAQAHRSFERSLGAALRFKMPYDEGLARYEIGRHLPALNPARRTHLQSAIDIFSRLNAAYDLARAQAALEQD